MLFAATEIIKGRHQTDNFSELLRTFPLKFLKICRKYDPTPVPEMFL